MTTQLNYIKSLNTKHISDINSYNPRDLTKNDKKPKYIQTASNCWLYAMLNNLYFNTGITINWKIIETFSDEVWKDSQTWWQSTLSTALICEKLLDRNIHWYSIDFRHKVKWKYIDRKTYTDKDINKYKIRLFTKLLLKWYVFKYSRIAWDDMKSDIREDDDIDKPLSLDNDTWRHATNIIFLNKKLRELGTRWDKSRYNEFDRANTDYFIQSIKNWTIRPTVLFIDFYQW